MNERIKELAEESYNEFYNIHIDLEKFAQLIVQECIDLISPYTVSMNRPGEEYLHPILEIRKHFGVE